MNEKTDGFNLLCETVVAVLIGGLLMPIASSTVAAVKYPALSESSPINKETGGCLISFFTKQNKAEQAAGKCLFHGVNHNFLAGSYRNNCNYIYGNMTGDNYEFPKFYQILNFTGCMIFTGLDKLERIPLSSVMMMKADNKFCSYKYVLMVYGNDNLKRIELRKDMDIKGQEVFIKANKQLRRDQVINAPFKVDVGTAHDCTMEMALRRKDCTTLVGDVTYPRDTYMRDVWSKVNKVYGTITAEELEDLDLKFPQRITVYGWQPRVIRIVNNRKLRYISEISKLTVTGPKPHFWFHNNTSFCHTADIRKKIEAKVDTKLLWDKKCLTRCGGGVVSAQYLAGIDKSCHIIDGDLTIKELKEMPKNSEKLAQIEKINGRLIVGNNSGIPDLSFLPNLEEISSSGSKKPSLEIVDNNDFALKGLDAIRKIHGNVYVRTEETSDVQKDVKQHIKSISDGKVTFAVRGTSTFVKVLKIVLLFILLPIIVIVLIILGVIFGRRYLKKRKKLREERQEEDKHSAETRSSTHGQPTQ